MDSPLKYAFVLSMVLMVKAYNQQQMYPTSDPYSKSHGPGIVQQKGRTHDGTLHSEIHGTPHYRKNADVLPSSDQRPPNEPSGRNKYSQHNSKDNRENHPKLFDERNRELQPNFELRDSFDDRPDSIKYSHNKESDNGDRNYQVNYNGRQSQPVFNDNTPRAKYNTHLESWEPQNTQHSHEVYDGRPQKSGDGGSLRYEPKQKNEQSRENLRHPEREKEMSSRPSHYMYYDERYQADKQQDQGNYARMNDQNYQAHLPVSGVGGNQESGRDGHYKHHTGAYSSGNEKNNDKSRSKDLHYYQEEDVSTAPPYSSGKKPSLPDQPSGLHDAKELFNDGTEYLSKHPDHRHTSSYHPSSSLSNANTELNHNAQDVPYRSHYSEMKHSQKHLALDDTEAYRDPHLNTRTQNYKQHGRTYESAQQHPDVVQRPFAEKTESKINHQDMPSTQPRSKNTMNIVESKKDMHPSPSEAGSDELVEEHSGFLDMGAYTDKKGSFGWYADFPVGKEHDKVTYSFSK